MPISLRSMLARNETHPATDLEGSRIFLDIESGDYLSLSGTAKAVWDFLATPQRVEAIVAHLCERYAVEPERCTAEVLPFLDELLTSDLLQDLSEDPKS